MGKHSTPFKYPGRISSSRFALNGSTPHAGAWRKVAQGTNFVSQRLRRCVASHSASQYASSNPGGPASAAGTTHPWHFLFRSGINLGQLDFILGLSPSTSGLGTDPRVRLRLRDVAAATSTYSDYYRYYRTDGSTTTGAWNDLVWAAGALSIPAEETFYRLSVECEDYGRIQSICAFERAPDLADDTNSGVCNPAAFEDHGQILDAHVQGVIEAQTELWRAHGRRLADWTREDTAGAVTVSATSYTNVFDASTTVTANTVGATLLTQYHDTRSGDIPCELAVYASRTAGTGTLDVRLQSASGTLCSRTAIPDTPNSSVGAVTIVANSAETKYDLQAKVSDGSTTYDIFALALWEYEA